MQNLKRLILASVLGMALAGCSDNANLTVADVDDGDVLQPQSAQSLAQDLLSEDAFGEPVSINDREFTDDDTAVTQTFIDNF
ncbi:MAG: hypothetical protein R3296_06260 [Oleiphilaceae bacterium]|nr:hypothetical protein [Oleiphilaceae bacterium]